MSVEKAIAGALRSTIDAHGPITRERIGSAVKRITGQLKAGDPTPATARPRPPMVDDAEMADFCATCGLVVWNEDDDEHECPPGFTS